MKLTAVVPFYNVELYLRDCLESIARQSMRDFEVILVDDGSPDGSRVIAEEYAAKDPRFRIITQENAGLGPARNTGMVEARGDYITFIDSDDVVPPGAWRLMVDRLDKSGSDFAAGNARRFNVHSIRQSWAHRVPFATDQSQTNVREFPQLANDRMVWNKVYRRSFWEKHGFSFPPIMYEDYPVTLAAHLLADSVEVVSRSIYMWRERDTGEKSITQMVFQRRNIDDRVTSDLMVLNLVAGDDVPPDVRDEVHRHLIQIDVVAVARAIALAPNDDRAAILARAQELVRALHPDAVEKGSRFARILIALIDVGDVGELSHFVDVLDRRAPAPTHTVVEGRRIANFDGARLAGVEPKVRELVDGDLALASAVTSVSWSGPRLQIDIESGISFETPGKTPLLRAWFQLRRNPAERVDAGVVDLRAVDSSTVAARLHVDGDALARDMSSRTWDLWVSLSGAEVTREAPVRKAHGAAGRSAVREVAEDAWLIPGMDSGVFTVHATRPDAWITRATPGHRDEIRLTGRSQTALPLSGLALQMSDERNAITVPVSVDPSDPTRWDSHIQLRTVAQHHEELPVTATITSFRTDIVTRRSSTQVHLHPSVEPLRLSTMGRDVQLGCGPFLGARVDESDHEFVIDKFTVTETIFSLHGLWYGDATDAALVLGWFHDPDNPERIEIPLGFAGRRACAHIDATELTSRMAKVLAVDPEIDEGARTEREWVLFFRNAERTRSVRLADPVLRQIPTPVRTPDGTVTLSNHHGAAGRFSITGPA